MTGAPVAPAKLHKVRLTLTSSNARNLDKNVFSVFVSSWRYELKLFLHLACGDLINRAKDRQVRVKGPIVLPTKVHKITTGKTPGPDSSKTRDRFEVKIHKRAIDLHSSSEMVKQITSISLEPGVEVEVSMTS